VGGPASSPSAARRNASGGRLPPRRAAGRQGGRHVGSGHTREGGRGKAQGGGDGERRPACVRSGAARSTRPLRLPGLRCCGPVAMRGVLTTGAAAGRARGRLDHVGEAGEQLHDSRVPQDRQRRHLHRARHGRGRGATAAAGARARDLRAGARRVRQGGGGGRGAGSGLVPQPRSGPRMAPVACVSELRRSLRRAARTGCCRSSGASRSLSRVPGVRARPVAPQTAAP
jgi:hypothetical protein